LFDYKHPIYYCLFLSFFFFLLSFPLFGAHFEVQK
jgi:hypothetical protein